MFISEVMFFATDCVSFLALYVLDTKETFVCSHVFVFSESLILKIHTSYYPSLVILC